MQCAVWLFRFFFISSVPVIKYTQLAAARSHVSYGLREKSENSAPPIYIRKNVMWKLKCLTFFRIHWRCNEVGRCLYVCVMHAMAFCWYSWTIVNRKMTIIGDNNDDRDDNDDVADLYLERC